MDRSSLPAPTPCDCGRSSFLTCEKAMLIYESCEKSIRVTLPRLGVRAGYVPGLGWRIYQPDIEALCWKAITDPQLARKLQGVLRTHRNRTKRRTQDVAEGA